MEPLNSKCLKSNQYCHARGVKVTPSIDLKSMIHFCLLVFIEICPEMLARCLVETRGERHYRYPSGFSVKSHKRVLLSCRHERAVRHDVRYHGRHVQGSFIHP